MRVLSIRCRPMCFPAVIGFSFILLTGVPVEAEMNLAGLQKLAKDVLRNDEVAVAEPMIKVEEGLLVYNLGRAGYIFDPSDFRQHPIESPILNQLLIETIRRFRVQASNRNFWEPVFARVSPMISQQLAIAQSKKLSEEKKFAQLGALDERIAQEYDRAMAGYARSRGLRVAKARPYAPPPRVQFVTYPGGGKVYVLHTLEHRMALAQGKKAPWHAVDGSSPVELQGKYWYKIEWGNRVVVGKKPIHVTKSGTITLR